MRTSDVNIQNLKIILLAMNMYLSSNKTFDSKKRAVWIYE